MPAWQRAALLIDLSPQRTAERFSARSVMVSLQRASVSPADSALEQTDVARQEFMVRDDAEARVGNRIRFRGVDWTIEGVRLIQPRGTYRLLRTRELGELSTLVRDLTTSDGRVLTTTDDRVLEAS